MRMVHVKITIDRIENGVAVAELPNGQMINVPGALFPDAAEGDVYTIEKDAAEAEIRRKRINEKMNRLFVD